ncbi:hypothetical protein TgHK011_001968 [Trichoderma gracile]|nr:hypothetical protein TgHK011_001968 [Trichoderma gracile]
MGNCGFPYMRATRDTCLHVRQSSSLSPGESVPTMEAFLFMEKSDSLFKIISDYPHMTFTLTRLSISTHAQQQTANHSIYTPPSPSRPFLQLKSTQFYHLGLAFRATKREK